MVKKAFILAAGLGTRLGNRTETKPKALVEVLGKPMLQRVIEKLQHAGINQFVINVHHLGGKVVEFLEQNKHFGAAISISDETDQLLNTGGALWHARKFFSAGEDILVHNVDVVSGLDLNALFNFHHQQQVLATLCVRNRESGRALLFDKEMKLTGWKNNTTGEYKWAGKVGHDYQAFAFNGIYMINTKFIYKMKMRGRFSIIDAWLEVAKENNIRGFVDQSAYWFDLGTTPKIAEAEHYLKHNSIG